MKRWIVVAMFGLGFGVGVFGESRATAAEWITLVSWPVDQDAKGYQGKVQTVAKESITFFTTTNWILLPKGWQVQQVKVIVGDDVQKTIPLENVSVTAIEPKPVPPPTEPVQPPSNLESPIPTRQQLVREIEEIERTLISATIGLGVGMESLEIQGGFTDVDASSPVGSTHVELLYSQQKKKRSAMVFQFGGEFHRYVFENESKNETAGTIDTETVALNRGVFDFRLGLELCGNTDLTQPFCAAGIGLGMVMLPKLKLEDPESAASSIEDKMHYTPVVGFVLHYPLWSLWKAYGNFSYMNLSPQGEGLAYSYGNLSLGYEIIPSLPIYLGLYFDRGRFRGRIKCVAAVGCDPTVVSRVSSYRGQLGLAYIWQ